MTVMRKPVNKDEVQDFFYGWKSIFNRALGEHLDASLADVVEQAAEVHLAVRNAAIFADAALEKMVEKLDELKANVE